MGLKIVGEIKPPEYKDPATMLRNIASNIEAGDYGDVSTIAVAMMTENGMEMFSGGRDSDVYSSTYLFGAAHVRLLRVPHGDN